MSNISLKSIKYESIKAIFTSIADAEQISRAEISRKTDLSLVTVGKIADALLDLNIVSQVKAVRPQAGRRAGLLSVNREKFALILDVTSYEFRFTLLNLRLELVDRSIFQNIPGLTFAENFNAFLSETAQYVDSKYDLENCFGVGVAVPGPYLSAEDVVATNRVPELCTFHIREAVHNQFPDLPLLIDSHINAAARSNTTSIENYDKRNIVYWYIGSHNVCGVHLVGGNMVLGRDGHACDFGAMRSLTDLTLEEKISLCKDQNECAESLALAFYNVIKILNPDDMILDFDLPYDCDEVIPLLVDTLTMKFRLKPEDMPTMRRTHCKFRNSHRGLTIGLRELWLDRIVFGSVQND